jgi:hypothetical protein
VVGCRSGWFDGQKEMMNRYMNNIIQQCIFHTHTASLANTTVSQEKLQDSPDVCDQQTAKPTINSGTSNTYLFPT